MFKTQCLSWFVCILLLGCKSSKPIISENEIEVKNPFNEERVFPNIPNHIGFYDSIVGDTVVLVPDLSSKINARCSDSTKVKRVSGELVIRERIIQPGQSIGFSAVNRSEQNIELNNYEAIRIVVKEKSYWILREKEGLFVVGY